MKIFKKRNFPDEINSEFTEILTETPSNKNCITYSALILGIGILTGISLCLLKKFKNPQKFKCNGSIIVHTTELN